MGKTGSKVRNEEACYFFGVDNLDQALKFLNRAAKALPNEEDIFRLMGEMGSSTGNASLELDAMAGLERIGKITDEMKVNRVFILFNQERYKECSEKVDAVLENFSRLKIKDKRKLKKKIEDIKEYCQLCSEFCFVACLPRLIPPLILKIIPRPPFV